MESTFSPTLKRTPAPHRVGALRCAGALVGLLLGGSADQPFTLAADAASGARLSVIEGVVTFSGAVPKSPIRDDAGTARDLLQVDHASGGLQNVTVWLKPVPTGAAEDVSKLEEAVMDQQDHEFVPRVLAVRAGQSVRFMNSDTANHNVRASSMQRANTFNVYTGINGSYRHQFAADPQQHPIPVGCDIHPWMRGWIYVFEHPFFAVTDAQGRFRISSVPPGKYEVALRQPDIRFAAEREVTVPRGGEARLQIAVRLDEASLQPAASPP